MSGLGVVPQSFEVRILILLVTFTQIFTLVDDLLKVLLHKHGYSDLQC